MRLSRLALSALALSSSAALTQTPLARHRATAEPLAQSTQAASELPITRVALYKNGVGFFEHAGRVTGDQAVSIDFTSAQLNDVLQSLTAVDLNGGRISGAGYNSTTPLDQQLKTLPLALNSDPSDIDFYNAIRGARVQLSQAGAPSFTGRLLSIDLRATSSPDHRFVTVVSDAGQTRTVELTPAVSVTLLDTTLHTDVTRYLELLASTRNSGLRHLTLLDRGPEGSSKAAARDLRVSYISEVPVWKSTYRILFTDAKQAATPTATLQGWSVVDNTTGSDWTNVHLDLIAGAPQSFIQPLSVPYYARRPEIDLPSEAQLAPQTHDSGEAGGGARIQGAVTDPSGAIIPNALITATNTATGAQTTGNSGPDGRFTLAVPTSGQYNVAVSSVGFNTLTTRNLTVGEQTARLNAQLQVGSASQTVEVSAAAPMLQTNSASMSVTNGYFRKRASPSGGGMPINGRNVDSLSNLAPIADYAEAAQASITPQTTSSAFDDFFQYSITDPITIRKNESAMVPILQTRLPIERVSLWSAQHPVALRAIWLTNGSQLTLDRGSFSVIENGSFGGEGLLDPIHPGEKRLLSYAADQAIHVDNQAGANQHRLHSIVIAAGILTEQFTDVQERDYTIRNAAPEPRSLILEHPRTNGFSLAPSTRPEETLHNAYRFRVSVPAGQTVHLKVAETRAYPRTIAVGSLNDQQVRAIVFEFGQVSTSDSKLLAELQPVFAAQRTVADLEARSSALDDKLTNLDSEEERQRANIAALKDADKTSQKRFVDELGKIEDQILDLQKQQQTLQMQLAAARADLTAKVQQVQFTQTLEP